MITSAVSLFLGIMKMEERVSLSKRETSPLFSALRRKIDQAQARYHVPGHKGGAVFPEEGYDLFRTVLQLDLTELEGLDNLHHPQGVIKEAEELAACQFGADRTYFLVGGSTVGNLAMILGCLAPGDLALVQRNSHQSIFHGLSLAQARCVPLPPEVCPTFHVARGVHPDRFRAALRMYPQAKAVIFTYPDYYGRAESAALAEMIQLAHQNGLLVLVDEAHGAHLGQYEELPPSALQLGADLCVQSTHKMLPAMTMTSMLHVREGRVPVQDVEQYLRILQSSSPSYPLMASLDLARRFLAEMGDVEWRMSLAAVHRLRRSIDEIGGYKLMDEASGYDPFKLVLQAEMPLSGFQLKAELEARGIAVELADPFNICLTLPLLPQPLWEDRLLTALAAIRAEGSHQAGGREDEGADMLHLWGQMESPLLSMRLLRSEEKEIRPLAQALHCEAAQMVTPYPPGIPLLIPGELIRPIHIRTIKKLREAGASIQGLGKEGELCLAVVKK